MEKSIIIVGMGGGISYAVALHFGQEKYKIGMISRNERTLATYQEMLQDDGIIAYHAVADAGVQSQLKSAIDKLKEKMGDPEVLLYNAACRKDKNILRETSASIASDFKVNVGGALETVKEVLEAMKRNNKGTLLFTGGGLALDPRPQYGSLSLGKAGLLTLTKLLVSELSYTSIKVGTVVVKGLVKPEDLKYNPTAIANQFWDIHSGKIKGGIVEY